MKPVLLLHGGAGRWRASEERLRRSIKAISEACSHGFRFLETGSAIEAVVEAVAFMEDSAAFNAGLGSVLNIAGEREMDAGVMDGSTGSIGAVAAVSYPKNPVRLAYYVMKNTEHVLLAGRGADVIAEKAGFERMPEPPEEIVSRYRELLDKYRRGEAEYYRGNIGILKRLGFLGTVGAVALDRDGGVAAAVSTGGIWLKLPGRVGDSPIPGAGFYADSHVAVAATGLGEAIIKSMASLRLAILVSQGFSLSNAGDAVIRFVTERIGEGTIGLIAVSSSGESYIGFNTEHMMVALKSTDKSYSKLLSRSQGR